MSRLLRYLEKTADASRSTAAIAYLAAVDHVESSSPAVARHILGELQDQRDSLKMIASENYCSLAVQLAMANGLTDKYAEGSVGHRFYAGCEHVDGVEAEAAAQLVKLYGCDHAYAQPHSGSDANLIALWAMLTKRVEEPELTRLEKKSVDLLTEEEFEALRQKLGRCRMLGMSLNSGGHLTHGYRHNLSGKMVQAASYEVDRESGLLDYGQVFSKAKEFQPDILIAGYSAYPRRINFAKMREIADEVGAFLWVDMAHFAGLVAGKVFKGEEDPTPYAHIITSTSHKTLRGPRGGFILCQKELADVVDRGCPLAMGGPLPHVMAAKAVAFQEAAGEEFALYSRRVVENAQALAEELMQLGEQVLTGGTDNHLVLVDVSPFGITGRQAELALGKVHIRVNRNAIPWDKNGPWYTSGIRIGTPALTTLGFGQEEMREVAHLLVDVLSQVRPTLTKKGEISRAGFTLEDSVHLWALAKVRELLKAHPLYPEIPDVLCGSP